MDVITQSVTLSWINNNLFFIKKIKYDEDNKDTFLQCSCYACEAIALTGSACESIALVGSACASIALALHASRFL